MKVRELIEKLQEFDGDLEVILCDQYSGNSSPLKTDLIVLHEYTSFYLGEKSVNTGVFFRFQKNWLS